MNRFLNRTALAQLMGAAFILTPTLPAIAQDDQVVLTVETESAAWIRNYNPFNQSTRLPTTLDFLYEPLVIFNVMQDGEPNYRLATGFTYSDDLTSVTFDLREGVLWSDGEPFTAQDVVFTFNLVKENPALDLQAIWTQIESVAAPDDHTVTITYKKPDTGLIYRLVQVYIVPEHVWADVEDPVAFTNPEPVGSGAFTEVARFTPQEFTQCRNPNYWDAENLSVDCLHYPQLAGNEQAMAAMARGEIDWGQAFIPDIERTYVATNPDHHGYWFPPGSLVAFTLNLEDPDEGNRKAFNDINFRRAFSMALDRQAMVDIAGYGYPTLNETPSGMSAAYQSWRDSDIAAEFGPYSTYNLEAAKQLLADSGYKDADGDGFIDNPDGSKISFDIIVPNGWTDWVNTCQLAIEGLTQLGLDANLATPEQPSWTDQLTNGTYNVAINSFSSGVTPQETYANALHSRNIGKSRQASARYANPELDTLIEGFYQTADQAEQLDIMHQIEAIVSEDLPFIAVFNNPLWYEYSTERFTGWFTGDNPVARPAVYEGVPERVLHVLALEPVAAE